MYNVLRACAMVLLCWKKILEFHGVQFLLFLHSSMVVIFYGCVIGTGTGIPVGMDSPLRDGDGANLSPDGDGGGRGWGIFVPARTGMESRPPTGNSPLPPLSPPEPPETRTLTPPQTTMLAVVLTHDSSRQENSVIPVELFQSTCS
jgi:hypothetical protein